MKILISGSSGFIGSNLSRYLKRKDYQVFNLVRSKLQLGKNSIYWNPDAKILKKNEIENFNCIIHLGGHSIAAKRWTKNQKSKIKQSRIQSTKFLVDTIDQLESPPKVFLSASAIGYYGNRGDEVLDEQSEKGTGFLPDICSEWEKNSKIINHTGVRTANLRFGMILSEKGGALKKMLIPFKLGLGGIIGNGAQYMPWIIIDDVIQAIEYIINNEDFAGAVNIVSPNPVINRHFTKILAKTLNRPAVLPLPAFAVRLILGQMGEELLLSSARVLPKKLIDNGFNFKFENLEDALNMIIPKRR